jgi:hypothetical protein
MKETELYAPVKALLNTMGYYVKAEVKSVDILALNEEKSIAVELKTAVTLKLIYQAIDRQKLADQVYVAIPKTAMQSHREHFNDFELLLKRLGIGLIIVQSDIAIIKFEPKVLDIALSNSRNTRKKKTLMNEFHERINHVNVGGTKGKVLTLYREKALLVAHALMTHPGLSTTELKHYTQIDNVQSILQKNYEGWFVKLDRAKYGINPLKTEDIKRYHQLMGM